MIHLAIPNLTGNEKKYLDDCIDTTFVSSVGQYVTRMEEMCKDASGSSFAVATSSGTTGLHAMLTAAGVGRDDLVILPTFTFIASANAVAHCGASPWLFDIDENWVIDAHAVAKALNEECKEKNGELVHIPTGRRVAAIMPVYTLGNMPEMDQLRETADRFHLPLLADAACAIGATYKGRSMGTLTDAAVFSFNGNKTITCGGGGMVIGNDERLMNLTRHITTTARVGTEYNFDMVGYNYRMTNVQAAIGCAQMERLEAFLNRKREVRRFYHEKLKDMKEITFFPETEGSAYWYSGIVLESGGLDKVREICERLKAEEIEARPFWKPVHLQKPYMDAPKQPLPNAESIWDRIVTLPCSTGITDGELQRVVDALEMEA